MKAHRLAQARGALSKRFELFIGVAYLAAWGSQLLLVNSRFWDDWIWTNSRLNDAVLASTDLGKPLWIPLFVVFSQAQIWVGHAAMLIANFVIAVLYSRIASNSDLVTSLEAKAIGVAVAILPLYFARVSLSLLPFTLAHLAFVVAWWMLGKFHSQQTRSILANAAIALLFFWSFTAESLIVFYFLPLVVTYARKRLEHRTYPLVTFVREHLWLFSLPIAFLAFRAVFMQPRGVYANYNSIDLLSTQTIGALGFTFGLLVFCIVRVGKSTLARVPSTRRAIGIVGFSLLAFELATLPYFLVGKINVRGSITNLLQINDWDSRVHLLMFLPIAIGLASVFQLGVIHFRKVAVAGASLLVLTSVIATNISTFQYVEDARKQSQLIEFLRTDPDVRNSNVVFYSDTTRYALHRHLRNYEYTGMLVEIHGTYDRLSLPYSTSLYEQLRGTDVANTYQNSWLGNDFAAPYKAVLIHISTDSRNQIVYQSEVLEW